MLPAHGIRPQEAHMRHTVIGVFDTYAQAEGARSALISAGFSRDDIELQANPKRDDAAEPTIAPDVETHKEPGMLANIERFFSMLFGDRDQPPEVAHYSEAVRRGAMLVAVDTPSIEQADITRATLSNQGAIDIDERAASWNAFEHGTTASTAPDDRDHSVLDELGLGRGSAVPGREPVNDPSMNPAAPSRARAYPRADVGDPAVEPMLDPLEDPLGDPLAKRDPVTLTSRDYITDPADDPFIDTAHRRTRREQNRTRARRTRSAGDDRRGFTGTARSANRHAGQSADRALGIVGRIALGTRCTRWPRCTASRERRRTDAGYERTRSASASGSRHARSAARRAHRYRRRLAPGERTARPARRTGTKPYQSTSGMQSQASGMQSQRMSAMGGSPDPLRASAGTQASGPVGPAPTGPAPIGPGTVPNEYMEYKEDFRADYDARYAATGEPYEDYQGAYRYGAMLGNDDRFHSRAWDEQMEYETRRDWKRVIRKAQIRGSVSRRRSVMDGIA